MAMNQEPTSAGDPIKATQQLGGRIQ